MTLIHQEFLKRQPSLEVEIGEPLSVSGLSGPLRIFQKLNGHRHSIDDTTTAWYALNKNSSATHILDLGSGVGTVGLTVLWGLGSMAYLTCIEAQEVSYKLLRANISCNGLGDRVYALNGDLRNLELQSKFSLITGSPPYFPLGTGVLPADSQKAHARFELRGDVGDYARVAKRHLSPDGVFVYCFPFQHKKRGIDLVEASGLKICTIRDVVPTPSKAPLFSLYSAKLTSDHPTQIEPPFVVANGDGTYTDEMKALQLSRGFGPDGTNVID